MAKPAAAELTVIILFKEGHLAELPSKKTYREYNTGWNTYSAFCTSSGDAKANIRSVLNTYSGYEQYAEQIVNTYCYATTMGGNKPYDTYCQFFYYWLLDLLINKLNVPSPLNVMKTVYDEFKNVLDGKGCKNINENIKEDIFPQVKTHFDYKQDYLTLQSQLGSGGSDGVGGVGGVGGTKTCDKKYHDHLTAIKSACSAVSTYCATEDGKTNSASYCGPFNAAKDGDENYCKENKLDILICDLVSKPQVEEPAAHAAGGIAGSTPTSGNHVTAGTVSSTLSILGLPAAAFFLYKYNLLPDWISNNFWKNNGGRNRNTNSNSRNRVKRSSTGRHHFDDDNTLTETSSTEYDSTSLGSSSNLTEDNSSLYTTTTTSSSSSTTTNSRRGAAGTNNRQGKVQKRQSNNNRNGHNRNIGYQNI
ncbi:KIR protein [Plasmodium coatneyi]|uniref:KIR protein n=1 Tax=Plasmodium coatneyi TaxID=208452 RepID=A0A1B1DXH4_9APIC|nr:KIR protein [Plasmodium coatneyi]ANQ07496.1 KIR protein [Plasmodium coatneyi]